MKTRLHAGSRACAFAAAIFLSTVAAGQGEAQTHHAADMDGDYTLGISELLRITQFFSLRGYHCAAQGQSEDGFMAGSGEDHSCAPHSSDYGPQDWDIRLSELLRGIQLYNVGTYYPCDATEDGFCAGTAPAIALAINAGGNVYSAQDGTDFAADTQFEGGTASTHSGSVTGTQDGPLYASFRESDTAFAYTIPVENGDYDVALHFVEPEAADAGVRVFDVSIEGTVALDDFDLFLTAGTLSAHVETIPVSISDGAIDLSFTAVAGHALVCAVAVAAAEPAPDTYTLTVASGSGSGDYEAGAVVAIAANAPDAGSSFDRWTGDVAAVADVLSASTTITMPAADTAVTATYVAQGDGELVVNNGSGDGSYAPGAIVPIVASEAPLGMRFAGWSGDIEVLIDAASPTTALVMPAGSVELAAVYEGETYPLSVFLGSGDGAYSYGESVLVIADAAPEGMVFERWTGDVAYLVDAYAAETQVAMPAGAATITASYAAAELRAPENFPNSVPGLDYFYYEGDDWDVVPDFTELTPVKAGTVPTITIAPRNQNDEFAFHYSGFLDIPTSGEYTFYMTSDDGSLLYIGDTLLIDNDGRHGFRWRDEAISLRAGKHAIRIEYFEHRGHHGLDVHWEGPGIARGPIPASALYSNPRTTYSLLVENGKGGGLYPEGGVRTIEADPAPAGQVFDAWTGDVAFVYDANAPATLVTMPAAGVSLTATYRATTAETYLLTVNYGAGGQRYEAGTAVTVIAEDPLPGYIFDGWAGETAYVSDTGNPATLVTMPAQDITIAARYRVDDEGPAITFATHEDGGYADENGFSLMGYATGRRAVANLFVSVDSPSLGRTVDQQQVSVSENMGQWAIRIWPDEFVADEPIVVTVTAFDTSGHRSETAITLTPLALDDYHTRLLNRITFGATPEWRDYVLAIGAEAYLEEQLNPDTIDDSEFDAFYETLDVDGINSFRFASMSRAFYSRKQLLEVMTYFWDNHFSTNYNTHGNTEIELNENDAFRENALGYFGDLVHISAHSPAMLRYLNNQQSDKDDPNENYARELMELHTLGVDGGYTQQDIVELARILTGWRGFEDLFFFYVPAHDYGEKVFLGETFPEDVGYDEGVRAIEMLIAHPSTARYVSTKLVEFFVADVPPQAVIDAAVATWEETGGHMQAVVRTILTSDAFRNAPDTLRNKIKNPHELVTGMVREWQVVPDFYQLQDRMNNMGQLLFVYPIPTGFSEYGEDWISSQTMTQRITLANEVAFHRGTWDSYFNAQGFLQRYGLESPEAIVTFVMDLLLDNEYTKLEYEAVLNALNLEGDFGSDVAQCDSDIPLRRMIALVMSLPGYQLQ